MSKKRNKRVLSADADALQKKLISVKEEILTAIAQKTKAVKYRYVEENGGLDTPEGYISLSNGLVHCCHDSDGNLNEVIVGIHTDKPYVQTDVQGEVSYVLFSNVNDLDLIAIISELDQQLADPETIEIVQEDEH